MRPFSPSLTPLHLCCSCEETLLKQMHPGDTAALIKIAAERYRGTRVVLEGVNARLKPALLGFRKFTEFEEECDWLLMAEEILSEASSERFRFSGTDGPQCRRRSLRNSLKEVHERQPGRILHKNFSEPLLKRTCLVDMTQAAPHRQDCGDMHKWTTMVFNRKHKSGGHYVEMGGSLRPKTLGLFVDSGLNAAMLKKTTESKMCVGGLATTTTDQSLMKYFAPFGAVECKVTMDPNHTAGTRTKGFGFVTFKDYDSLQEALKLNHVVDNRPIDCKESVVKAVRENRHNKRQFYGMDTWKKEVRETPNKATLTSEVGVRAGSRLASTEEWQPMRSRKNALSLSYTLPNLSATA